MNRIEIDATTENTGSLRIRLPGAALCPVQLVIEWSDPPDTGREAMDAGPHRLGSHVRRGAVR